MLEYCFSDLLDLTNQEHYQLQEVLAAQTCSDDYDDEYQDYLSVGVEG